MKKSIKILGGIFIIMGIFLTVIQPFSLITGAAIDSFYHPDISFFISIILIIIGIFLFEFANNDKLEDITEAETNRLGVNIMPDETELTQEQQEYVNKNAPSYLKDYKPTLFYKLYRFLGKTRLKEVHGKDKLPEGAKLFIMNHRVPYSEYMSLIASLDEPVHPFVAKNFGWKYFPWISKKIGAIPMDASLMNMSDEQKRGVVKKIPFIFRGYFKRELEREGKGYRHGGNIGAVKTMTSMLMQGRPGVILAEGPSFKTNEELERAYAGYALVAREYERRTGKKLPIVPVGNYSGRVAFGDAFYIDEKGKQKKEELETTATQKIRSLYNFLSQRR